MLAGLLGMSDTEAMDTESTVTNRQRKAIAPGRTLSTLESRPVESMGSDTDSFVRSVSFILANKYNC